MATSRDENDGSEAAQVLRHPTFTGESDARQFPGHVCFRMVKLGVAGLAIIMYNNVVYSRARLPRIFRRYFKFNAE